MVKNTSGSLLIRLLPSFILKILSSVVLCCLYSLFYFLFFGRFLNMCLSCPSVSSKPECLVNAPAVFLDESVPVRILVCVANFALCDFLVLVSGLK